MAYISVTAFSVAAIVFVTLIQALRMTTAQVFTNGVQLGSPAPPDKYPLYGTGSGDVTGPAAATNNALVRFDGTTGKLVKNSPVVVTDLGAVTGIITINGAPVGDCSGPAGATDSGIALFNGSSGKLLKSNPTTVDGFGGITLAAGAQTFPVVPAPSPTPLNYFEDRSFTGVNFTGPFAGSIANDINFSRVGDRLAMAGIGEVRTVSDGTVVTIAAPAGTIPANFRPTLNRICPVAVILTGTTFDMGLCYLRTDGSIIIGPGLNTNNANAPGPFTGVLGQTVGFRAFSVIYAI